MVRTALADHTRRDIVRRAIDADERSLELASHYPMSFAAVQQATQLEELDPARRLVAAAFPSPVEPQLHALMPLALSMPSCGMRVLLGGSDDHSQDRRAA